MRCCACARTIPPVQARSFAGYNFCKNCYNILDLKNGEMRDPQPVLSLVSFPIEPQPVRALMSIASTFDRRGQENLVRRFASRDGHDDDTLAFLLTLKALQQSSGTATLTTAGGLALFSLAGEITSDIVKHISPPLSNEPSIEELQIASFEVSEKLLTLCEEILESMETFPYSDSIKQFVEDSKHEVEEARKSARIDFSTVEEGIEVKCSGVLADFLHRKFGDEYVFTDWEELRTTFEGLEGVFGPDGYYFFIPETPHVPIYLLVGDTGIYATTKWKEMKDVFLHDDFATFLDMLKDGLPLFVIEKAAGGMESLQRFVKNALSIVSGNVDLVIFYAGILEKSGKSEESSQFLEEKMAEIPDNVEILAAIATKFFRKSQLKKTIELLEKVLALDNERWDFLKLIGKAYEAMGNYEKAMKTYERIAERDPESFFLMRETLIAKRDAVVLEVDRFISEELYANALALVEKYFDPVEVGPFYFFKAVILSEKGELKAALGLLTDYLDVYSEEREGWMEKAGIYMQMRQFPAAARCFRRCADLEPGEVEPLVLEALCYRQIGHSRSYKKCINEARKIDQEKTKELLKKYNF